MNDEIIFFAKTNFRNKEQIFGIKQDDRRRHMYVIGKTGMGKTNLIQNMAIQDIRNGKGVAIVDPHGEFAEECLKAVPANRINDVIYFNPADTANPIAMNVMEKVDPEYRHLIASGLVGVFKKIWADSWGPRLEYLLRNAILALLEYPTSTLLGVTKILVDKEYRTKVMEKVSDPVIKSFWTEEFTKYHDRLMADAIAPIQNKVGQFLSSSLIRNIVGQVKSSFDIRYVMDNQKILIMNLSKGRIGEDNSALLGAMMITKIQLAAMARVDMPENQRKDFYLYVDEFQNFATESFANILSEARKYRLNLVLAHQYITQLDERVQNAVFGNVGTLITFRVGASDAEFLEKEFSPVFYMTDLVNLAKYNIYLKLMIDGVATSPFSANTLPPIDTSDTGVNYEKIIRVSAERYGTPRKIVEDKINRWSGVTSVEVKDKLEEIIKEERKAKIKKIPDSFSDVSKTRKAAKNEIERSLPSRIKEQKEMNKGGDVILKQKREINKRQPVLPKNEYETECSVCSAKIKVPFKPDGQRPVFCKECLKEYRRAQMKLQNEIKSSERKQHSLTPKDKKVIESKKKNNRGELKALIEKAMSQRKKG
ncbi:MAG: type IV secretion system DNA-binding domain-containing protein [Candidatus Moranbacteria bacterium]|nr:type IV secretion system DNA-binding domain-containing protein [Candidatus Moranbacteria bacterium]